MKARVQLKKKAGFDSLVGTSKLKVVKEHHLVKDGLYNTVSLARALILDKNLGSYPFGYKSRPVHLALKKKIVATAEKRFSVF